MNRTFLVCITKQLISCFLSLSLSLVRKEINAQSARYYRRCAWALRISSRSDEPSSKWDKNMIHTQPPYSARGWKWRRDKRLPRHQDILTRSPIEFLRKRYMRIHSYTKKITFTVMHTFINDTCALGNFYIKGQAVWKIREFYEFKNKKLYKM